MISLSRRVLDGAHLQTTNLSFRAGDTVFQRGMPAQFVYVISKGALFRFRQLPGGRRSILQFLFAGDGFGYEQDGYHRDTVRALTNVEVLAAQRIALADAAKSPSEELFAAAARSIAIVEEQAALVRGTTATERMALFLLEMSSRMSARNRLVLPMTRRHISDYLGVRLETVSRAMNEFHRAKIIEIHKEAPKRIVIHSKRRLAKLASDASNFEWWKR